MVNKPWSLIIRDPGYFWGGTLPGWFLLRIQPWDSSPFNHHLGEYFLNFFLLHRGQANPRDTCFFQRIFNDLTTDIGCSGGTLEKEIASKTVPTNSWKSKGPNPLNATPFQEITPFEGVINQFMLVNNFGLFTYWCSNSTGVLFWDL